MATKGTRPNQKAKIQTALNPSNFTGIADRSTELGKTAVNQYPRRPQPDAAADKWSEFEKKKGEWDKNSAVRSTGNFAVGVLLGRKGIDKNTIRNLDFSEDIEEFGRKPGRETIIAQYAEDFGDLPVGNSGMTVEDFYQADGTDGGPNLRNKIIVMKSRPQIEFDDQGDLQVKNSSKTVQQLVVDLVKDIERFKNQKITVDTISQFVKDSGYNPSDADRKKLSQADIDQLSQIKQKQAPYLASILGTFIRNPDKGDGLFPMQIAPHVEFPKRYEIAIKTAINTDFGEMIGPIAFLTGNTTGNAARIAGEFWGGWDTRKLMETATIHFNPVRTDKLYDTFIEAEGKVIGVSSKAWSDGKKPTMGTAISGLAMAINEVKTNPVSLDLLKKALKDRETRRMFDIVSVIADDTWEQGNEYQKVLRVLQLLDPVRYPTKYLYQDLRTIKQANARSNQAQLTAKNLSPFANEMIKQGRYSNRHDKNILEKLSMGSVNYLIDSLNKDPKFSEVCAWLLNHSATVQIDVVESDDRSYLNEAKQKADKTNRAYVLTDIVATWPSTAVDHIELIGATGTLRFMLGVNGFSSQFPDRAQIPWAEAGLKDMFEPQPDDAYNHMTSQQDWEDQGVNRPRSTVDLPTSDGPINTVSRSASPTKPAATPKQAPKATQAITSGGPLTKMRQFVATTGIVRNENSPLSTPNKLIHFVEGILRGTAQFPANFETSFRTLLSDKSVLALVRQHTKKIKDHPTDIDRLYENLLGNQDLVVTIVATLYWAWMARVYHSRYPDKNYHQVALENVKRLLKELNVHRASDDEIGKHVRTIDRFGIQ